MLKLKILVVLLFVTFTGALLLTENAANPHARGRCARRPRRGINAAPNLEH